MNNELYFGIPGFKDFSGSACFVDHNLKVTKLNEFKSNTNTYTGYSVAGYDYDEMHVLVAGSPKYNQFRGKVRRPGDWGENWPEPTTLPCRSI